MQTIELEWRSGRNEEYVAVGRADETWWWSDWDVTEEGLGEGEMERLRNILARKLDAGGWRRLWTAKEAARTRTVEEFVARIY